MMSPGAPYIPESAPFTADQRAWLNGFLAGLFSSSPQPGAEAAPRKAMRNVTVYFATQSGTAERLAKKMAKELKAQGHTASVANLEKTTPAQLAMTEDALFFASTYGEGDPPDGVKAFRDALSADAAPRLDTLRYSLFALGDRHYEQFCRFGIELDERLRMLGARPLLERVESDVDVDEPFAAWKDALMKRLADSEAAAHGSRESAPRVTGTTEPAQVHTRETPFYAQMVDRRALTHEKSSKLTVHVSLGLEDSAVHYQPGDACGVIATNSTALVEEILEALPFDGGTMVELSKAGRMTAREALGGHLQVTRATRKMVQHFAHKSGSKTLSALLPAEQGAHLEHYLHGRGLIDLLCDYGGAVETPEELVEMLPRLAPRLYSISSSPAKHGREVHCTIAVVRYRTHDRERGGVASTMLAERVEPGASVPMYIQPNKRFRLPADGTTPMVMVGPGTGIAPFRSFLHEREALGQRGKNWLFFGERSAETDFLYCRELKAMVESGHLTRLDTAFSRDQAKKVYVQDRMLEQGAQLWAWLQEGAQFFVCGDATYMAKDVDHALHTVVGQHGGLSDEAAREYVEAMVEEGRYHRDVY